MISVAMAVCDGEKYIEQQLRSIMEQTKIPDEIVISDDASCDRTLEIVDDIRMEFEEAEIPILFRVIRNKVRQGYIRNFRNALEKCRGDIIFLCDQDDIWMRDKVSRMTALLEKYPQIQVLASGFSMIDENGDLLPDHDRGRGTNQNLLKRRVPAGKITNIALKELIYHNFCQGCAMAFRKNVKDEFLENFTDSIPHDWQINLSAAVGGGTYFYDRKLFRYRIHRDNTTGLAEGQSLRQKKSGEVRMKVPEQGLENLRYLQERYPEYFEKTPGLKKRLVFTKKNLQAMRQRKILPLMLQNLCPFYGEMKSFLGRMLDLWYVVNRSI
ncbi:MAG TPA: hypothetical protein DCM49_03600 [Lachnospiraceae bacterium]|nr:hypothetical protein [Lachnospiraceae bacterium]